MPVGRFRSGYRAGYRATSSGLFVPIGGVAEETYIDKVLALSPIAYWPMNETSGTSADNAEGTAARDGTFARNVTTMGTEIGIGDGNTAPDFDGTQDTCNVFSASFVGAFNGDEGTMAVWVKVSGAGVWTDGYKVMMMLRDDTSNLVEISSTGSSTLSILQVAGGTTKQRNKGSMSTTDWFHAALTWSLSGNAVKVYFNGVQEGATLTGLGTFVGPLIDFCHVGSKGGASNWWDGDLAHPVVWSVPLDASTILDVATV